MEKDIFSFDEFLNEVKKKPILQDFEKDINDFTSMLPSKAIPHGFVFMIDDPEINKHVKIEYNRITKSGMDKPYFKITELGQFFKGETFETQSANAAANYIKMYMALKDFVKETNNSNLLWHIRKDIKEYPDMKWNKFKHVVVDIAEEQKIDLPDEVLKKLGMEDVDKANRSFGL